ncbi:MAG: hypothetical protein SWY16_16145 [Cyanobacteriota bacterium]|nr:hypothetical protein [Cyanobacteriota bacterium]
MKLDRRLTQGLFLLAAPIVAGSTLSTPTLAATFASSDSAVNLFNFSQAPASGSFSLDADAQAFNLGVLDPGSTFDGGDSVSSSAGSGSIFAGAEANATLLFNEDPAEAFNNTSNFIEGNGREYSVFTNSSAQVIGNFFLETPSLFSFDFEISSILDIAIDDLATEKARASSDISFAIFGGTSQSDLTLLDAFSISALLNTRQPDQNTTIQASSNNFNFSQQSGSSFGSSQMEESIAFFVEGSYERSFNAPTYLTVVEVKNGNAAVEVPEPFESSILLSLLVTVGTIGMRSKLKSKKL